MLTMKLLIAFAMVTGIVAEQCTMDDFSIQDIASTVEITNANPNGVEMVTVTFDHGSVASVLDPGASETVMALASLEYTATVTGPTSDYGVSYRERLLDLRDGLLEVLSSGAALDRMSTVAVDLGLVQSALGQLRGSKSSQSCHGLLTTGVSHVRVNETIAGGVQVWVIDCS
jgi:hypothetical protein